VRAQECAPRFQLDIAAPGARGLESVRHGRIVPRRR
jgi:hypothetical protein